MLRYRVVKESFYHSDIGRYSSYGIKIINTEHGKRREIGKVSDISTEKKRVKELAALCRRGQLSPMHLIDVIEDFIG